MAIHGFFFCSRFFLGGSWFYAFLLLLLCLSSSLLFCFSCFLLFLLLCLFALPASFLFSFSAFSAFVLLCLSTSYYSTFPFLQSYVFAALLLLVCFSGSCLYCLFVVFLSFAVYSPVCILNETLKTLAKAQRTANTILIRNPYLKPSMNPKETIK